MASAPNFSAILANFKLETIGTILTPVPFTVSKISLENPAPQIIISTFSSIDTFTASAKFDAATIIFTPSAPPFSIIISFAFLISALNSSAGIAVPDITPTPPWFATAEANLDIDALIPIPPWIIGTSIFKSPIFT